VGKEETSATDAGTDDKKDESKPEATAE